jgi:transcriptional regulator with XRE-family HTH domain
MTGYILRQRRISAGISGSLLCARTGIDRSRLSHIERQSVKPSITQMEQLARALEELIEAKRKVTAAAKEYGWPVAAL